MVCYTVLTVPPGARARLCDPKDWQRVRKGASCILKRFGLLYGVEVTHPHGEGEKEFHPHLNFLWRPRPGLGGFLDVVGLREAWAAYLGVPVADVHHKYNVAAGKVWHWCKYVARTFPGFGRWAGPVRWYGKYPRAHKREREAVRCDICGKDMEFLHDVSSCEFWSMVKRGKVRPPRGWGSGPPAAVGGIAAGDAAGAETGVGVDF